MDYWKRDHRRRSYDRLGHAHVLTFTCYQRFRFLESERTCRWLAESLDRGREQLAFQIFAYVFMPEHVHLLVQPIRPETTVSAILRAVKQPVGHRAVAYLKAYSPEWLPRITRVRNGRTERLFWQSGGGYDRNIIESRTMFAEIAYIHENPCRRRLATRATDWKWSSAGWFEGEGKNTLRPDPIPWEWTS